MNCANFYYSFYEFANTLLYFINTNNIINILKSKKKHKFINLLNFKKNEAEDKKNWVYLIKYISLAVK